MIEYVTRRALLALCNRKSGQAEALALRSWGTGLEYQQIAALHVLSRMGQPNLKLSDKWLSVMRGVTWQALR